MWGKRISITDRKRTYHSSVEVEIEVSISDLTSEDLIRELQSRGDWIDPEEEATDCLTDVLDAIKRRDIAGAELLIERYMYPKWHTPSGAEKEMARRAKAASTAS